MNKWLSVPCRQAAYHTAYCAEQKAVNGQLDDVFECTQRQRCQARWAIEHRQENGIQADVDQYDDYDAGSDDLPEFFLGLVKEEAVDQAAQQRGEREAGKVGACWFEQKTEDVAQRTLNASDNRAEEDGGRR